MSELFATEDGLFWKRGHQTLKIEPWGQDAFRVRATLWKNFGEDRVGALIEPEDGTTARTELSDRMGRIDNGRISCEIERETGGMRFLRDGETILSERSSYYIEKAMPARRLVHGDGELFDVDLEFASSPDERFFGMGQNPTGSLNLKGNRMELRQRNGHVSIPFTVSSRNYGFLWNNPALGDASFDQTLTRWRARGATGLDYWITVGDGQKDIISRYTRATGLAPRFPHWATGYWQCRLRYANAAELREVAETHLDKGYPLSVIVIDYFHWSRQGEWRFHETDWPDIEHLVAELEARGIKVMVSVWPSVGIKADTYPEMKERGLLLRARNGLPFAKEFMERGEDGPILVSYYDATNPEAREFVWERCRAGYYDKGIKVWWLDGCEPEVYPESQEDLLYQAGSGTAVSNAYPFFNAKAFYDGMRSQGEEEILLFSRSAWAGCQRLATLVWCGDVDSDFRTLGEQIRLGLNAAASGMSWWSTDIGGFNGGRAEDEEFRELLVRWFQFGVFCPVTRLHGNRLPTDNKYGGPNELWSFGEQVERMLAEQLSIREGLRDYVQDQMDRYSQDGTPFMRSLEMEFPEDPDTVGIEDAYMFGDRYLVAPVLSYGARARPVYLPGGNDWHCHWNGTPVEGGRWIEADAPLSRIPVFTREVAAR